MPMEFPLQLKRQFSGPLDVDSLFVTKAAMEEYKTSPLSYPGMIVSCIEDLKAIYVLNLDKTQWNRISASSGGSIYVNDVEIVADETGKIKITVPKDLNDLTDEKKIYTKNEDNKLINLQDVLMLNVEDGQVPMFDQVIGKFINKKPNDSDERVKIDSDEETAYYLSELLSNEYFNIDKETHKITAIKFKDQTVTMEEINRLTGLDQNIMTYIKNLKGTGIEPYMEQSFDTYADLLTFDFSTLDDSHAWMIYVVEDEENGDGNGTAYICNTSTNTTDNKPLYVGLTNTEQRDLSKDKVDLTSEVKNRIKYDNLPEDIAKKDDIVVSKEKLQEIEGKLADLLYKPVAIVSFTNNNNNLQLGSHVTSIIFTWEINKQVAKVLINDQELEDPTQTTFTISGVDVSSNSEFTLKVIDERENTATAITNIKFMNKVYYGASNATVIDSNFISTLTGKLASSKENIFTVNATGDDKYIYYAIPSSYGTPVFSVGGFNGGFDKINTVQFTNSDSHVESYDIYRSTNPNLGTTTVVVK